MGRRKVREEGKKGNGEELEGESKLEEIEGENGVKERRQRKSRKGMEDKREEREGEILNKRQKHTRNIRNRI